MNKQFKNAKYQKGALPTCINVNNTVEHFSPSNEDTTELKWDDVVKVYISLLRLFIKDIFADLSL